MRVINILKSKSGVSIIYVIATMSLFLALSVAVLSAASSSYGTVHDTTKDSQIRTIAMSVSETFLSSLNNPDPDAMLGEDFVEYLYFEEVSDPNQPVQDLTLHVDFSHANFELPDDFEISSDHPPTLSFRLPGTNQSTIQIYPIQPHQDAILDSDGNELFPAQPQKDAMTISMTLTTTYIYDGDEEAYQTTYQCSEIYIEEDLATGEMVVTEHGTWTQVGFERV